MIDSFYEGKVTVFNDAEEVNDWEEWDVTIDTDQGEFFFVWEDSGFDMDFSDMPNQWKKSIKTDSETAHHIINGVFKLVGDK